MTIRNDGKLIAEIEKIMAEFSSDQLIKAAHALATEGVKIPTADTSPYRVRSFTRPSVWYRTTVHACSCDAHVLCWHMAAVRIRALLPMVDEMAEFTGTVPSGRTEVWPS